MRGPFNQHKPNKNHKAKAKQNPHKQTKNKTRHNPRTARSAISWSVHSHLKRIRRDENIVSPLGLVWQNKTRANNKSRKCHTAICEPGSNKSTMRKPRLPPEEPRDHRVVAARATFSQITSTQSKSQQDTAMWQKESLKLNTVKRGVKTDLRSNDRNSTAVTALRGNSDSS